MTTRTRIVLAAAVALLCALSAAPSEAQTRASVYFQPGITSHHFTGQVGRYASGSVGVGATQGIQLGLFGTYLAVGTDFHLTNQPPPPYSRGLRTFAISTGIRVMPRMDPLQPFGVVEYTNLGIASNTLVRYTGDRSNFNAIGGGLGVRWRPLAPFHVEAQFNTRYYVDMRSPTASFGGIIAFGLSGDI